MTYVSDVPYLVSQWDNKKNGSFTASSVTTGSHVKVWWVCDKGHSWEASVSSRARGQGCPYCAGKRVLHGFNDLATTHPDIAAQLHKDNELSSQDITAGSNKKMTWICDKGHTWEAKVARRVEGSGCPYCSNNKVLPGFNDLATTHPDIAAQLHKDNELSSQDITAGSGKKLLWVCDNNHTWKAQVRSRANGNGCPYCSGRKVLSGFNDLATTHPDIAVQLHRDNALSAHNITAGSQEELLWTCSKGHHWKATVSSRVRGRGCPYCAGRKVFPGDNDINTAFPDIAQQWDKDKNYPLLPSDVTCGSGRKVWWCCEKGHTWQARISDRSRGQGCPHCAHITSKSEDEVVEYITTLVGRDNVRTSVRNIISPQELDIYIPEKNIAIEFNGLYWHSESQGKDRYYHYNKWKKCKDRGIQLITIWEDEWRGKRDIVKSMLVHKLGLSQKQRVYARKCSVVSLDSSVARQFLDAYHIQGGVSSSTYIGLQGDSGDILAVSAWKKNKEILYLDRYATSCIIVGGMGKLLKAGKDYAISRGCMQIVTFSDHCVSDGHLYEMSGFVRSKELSPDYKYVVKGTREHKFAYRLARFRNDPLLHYEEDMTERELSILNGLTRIWDCGKTRWVMDVQDR